MEITLLPPEDLQLPYTIEHDMSNSLARSSRLNYIYVNIKYSSIIRLTTQCVRPMQTNICIWYIKTYRWDGQPPHHHHLRKCERWYLGVLFGTRLVLLWDRQKMTIQNWIAWPLNYSIVLHFFFRKTLDNDTIDYEYVDAIKNEQPIHDDKWKMILPFISSHTTITSHSISTKLSYFMVLTKHDFLSQQLRQQTPVNDQIGLLSVRKTMMSVRITSIESCISTSTTQSTCFRAFEVIRCAWVDMCVWLGGPHSAEIYNRAKQSENYFFSAISSVWQIIIDSAGSMGLYI